MAILNDVIDITSGIDNLQGITKALKLLRSRETRVDFALLLGD